MSDPFTQAFKKGAPFGHATVESLIESIRNEMPAGSFPSKKAQDAYVAQSLAGFSAAFVGTLLYRFHRELERILVNAGKPPNEAELWVQKVFTLFVDELRKEKVPVECKFVISRKK